jgi:hypothetical protein
VAPTRQWLQAVCGEMGCVGPFCRLGCVTAGGERTGLRDRGRPTDFGPTDRARKLGCATVVAACWAETDADQKEKETNLTSFQKRLIL